MFDEVYLFLNIEGDTWFSLSKEDRLFSFFEYETLLSSGIVESYFE